MLFAMRLNLHKFKISALRVRAFAPVLHLLEEAPHMVVHVVPLRYAFHQPLQVLLGDA
jgi:hypothetical protein